VAAAALSSARGWLRTLPVSGEIVAAIRCVRQLQNELKARERQHSQQQQPLSHPAAPLYEAGCGAAASVWCDQCGQLCADHDSALHPRCMAMESHCRMTLAERRALQQSRLVAQLEQAAAAEAAQLKATQAEHARGEAQTRASPADE